jgi:hypothetical protein
MTTQNIRAPSRMREIMIELSTRRVIVAAFVGTSVALSLPLTAQSTAAPSTCSGRPFKHLTARYDRVRGKTVVSLNGNLPRSMWKPKTEALLLEAEHSGEASDSVITPRLFLIQNTLELGVQTGSAFTFHVLSDDSVRYSWPSGLGQLWNGHNGFGLGLVPVIVTPVEYGNGEFTRFAQAKQAVVEISGRQYKLDAKDLLPLAEIDRWSSCPDDRKLARKKS